jgi:redox-sensing transcriptional repressor
MRDLSTTVAAERINLGIVAVPRESAQQVADALVAAGVRGILNFAPRRIEVREGIGIVSVDFTVALEQLAFQTATGLDLSFEDGHHADEPTDGDAPTSV